MDSRFNHKLKNLKKALLRLQEGSAGSILSELEKDGLLQRFEFTFELAWETLQEFFTDKGLEGIFGPKEVLKKAFELGMIEDQKIWTQMMTDRNLMSHIYDDKQSKEVFQRIQKTYVGELEKLVATFIK